MANNNKMDGKLQSQQQQTTENKKSELLYEDENELIFTILGRKCCSLSTTVVRLLVTQPPDHIKWHIKCMAGVVCFVKDNPKRSYFIRVYDFDRKTMIFEQELYTLFEYKNLRPNFHCFEADTCMAALNFVNEQEAEHFLKTVQGKLENRKRKPQDKRLHQNNLNNNSGGGAGNHQTNLQPTDQGVALSLQSHKQPIKSYSKSSSSKNSKLKKKGISKKDISNPFEFKHVQHIGWNSRTQCFETESVIDANLLTALESQGISQEQLNDEGTRNFIHKFINDWQQQDGNKINKTNTNNNGTQNHHHSGREHNVPLPPPPPPSIPPAIGSSSLHSKQMNNGYLGNNKTNHQNHYNQTSTVSFPPPPPSSSVSSNSSSLHHSAGHQQRNKTMAPQAPAPPPPPPPPPSFNGGIDNSTMGNGQAPAPPPPPPPPPPSFGNSAPVSGGAGPKPPMGGGGNDRSALMEAIRKGGRQLNHVEPGDLATSNGNHSNSNNNKVNDDPRSRLMDEIKKPPQLRKVEPNTNKPELKPTTATEGLAGALARALQERSRALNQTSDSSNDESASSDDEWDDRST